METPKDHRIIELLRNRDSIKTEILLANGKRLFAWNIAWGYDMGDEFAHITTNISPAIKGEQVDFFYSNEIKKIVDPATEHPILDLTKQPLT